MVPVDPKPDQTVDQDDPHLLCRKLFANAILVHGIKHVCDNALKNILPEMGLPLGRVHESPKVGYLLLFSLV